MKKLLYLPLLLVLSQFVVGRQINHKDDGLGLLFHFNEGTGTNVYGSSPYHHAGTLEGNAAWVDGKYGKAIHVDGLGDKIEISPGASAWDDTQLLSLFIWVYIESINSNDQHTSFIVISDGLGVIYLYYNNNSNKIEIYISDVGSYVTSDSGLEFNKWNFVGCTWDGSVVRFYINGEPDGVTAYVGTKGTETDAFRVGSGQANRDMVGDFDEPFYYNRILPDGEVKIKYLEEKGKFID